MEHRRAVRYFFFLAAFFFVVFFAPPFLAALRFFAISVTSFLSRILQHRYKLSKKIFQQPAWLNRADQAARGFDGCLSVAGPPASATFLHSRTTSKDRASIISVRTSLVVGMETISRAASRRLGMCIGGLIGPTFLNLES